MRLLPRVLIVDDEPAIAELISLNLRHNGFTPAWAEDGESAQRELDTEMPDVTLLDWMLPGENGLLLARKWRADQRMRRNFSDPASGKITVGNLTLDLAAHRVTFNGKQLRLGPREFKLLHYFMTHAERTHTRSQVLDTVWSDDALIEERTVDVHVMGLREALGEAGAMIETVRGTGYRITTDSQPRL